MKTTFYFFLASIILFICFSSFGQVKDSLIQLTPEIGDTISAVERAYYNLFPAVDGFISAFFTYRDESSFIMNITYKNEGSEIQDTSFTEWESELNRMKKMVNEKDRQRTETSTTTLITITTLMGEEYTGYLISVNDDKIYFSETTNDELIYQSIPRQVSIDNIKSVLIHGESKVLTTASEAFGGGFIIGMLLGSVAGSEENGDENVKLSVLRDAIILGLMLGLISSVIGLVVGFFISTSDEVIDVDIDYDFLQLNKYAVYPFSSDQHKIK